MENNEFLKVCIKNRACYYFDEIIKLQNFDLDNILIDEKSHGNILIYDISYKNLIVAQPYDGTRYLTLLGSEKHDTIYDRIRYLISLKSGITYSFSHIFAKNKVDSYDSLPIEKKIDFA